MTNSNDTDEPDASPEADTTLAQELGVDDPLEGVDDVVEEAAEQRQATIAAFKELKEVEEDLHHRADLLLEQGHLEEHQREQIDALIDDGHYGKVRSTLETAAPSLTFEDEEKETLVAALGKEFQQLVADVEMIRNALLDLPDKGWEEEDLVAYVYGSHPSLNKGTIETVMDLIGDVSDTDVEEVDTLAAYIAHSTHHDVKVDDARRVVEALKNANHRGGTPSGE